VILLNLLIEPFLNGHESGLEDAASEQWPVVVPPEDVGIAEPASRLAVDRERQAVVSVVPVAARHEVGELDDEG